MTPPPAPRRIGIALYHRDSYSTGRMRQVFQHAAFHWSLIAVPMDDPPGKVCWTCEATDASYLDPVTYRMVNPTMDWWLKHRDNVDRRGSSKMVGIVFLGTTNFPVTYEAMLSIARTVPMPIMNRDPQQSCVTWITNAMRAFQQEGWLRPFSIEACKDFALSFADERMREENRDPEHALIEFRG